MVLAWIVVIILIVSPWWWWSIPPLAVLLNRIRGPGGGPGCSSARKPNV